MKNVIFWQSDQIMNEKEILKSLDNVETAVAAWFFLHVNHSLFADWTVPHQVNQNININLCPGKL